MLSSRGMCYLKQTARLFFLILTSFDTGTGKCVGFHAGGLQTCWREGGRVRSLEERASRKRIRGTEASKEIYLNEGWKFSVNSTNWESVSQTLMFVPICCDVDKVHRCLCCASRFPGEVDAAGLGTVLCVMMSQTQRGVCPAMKRSSVFREHHQGFLWMVVADEARERLWMGRGEGTCGQKRSGAL